ncbi:N-6 DNA methylase [Streptomyces sp. ISL-94]|nr:N-6 DNA methylase [Streptomyces sp. ISL-94]
MPSPATSPTGAPQVTAAEISRIAGVTRATVSNWRRRHEDFPTPAGGTESSPLYDLEAVQSWLQGRGQASAATPAEELRTTLRLHAPGSGIAARLVPLVLAAGRTGGDPTHLSGLQDREVLAWAERSAEQLDSAVPTTGPAHYAPDDAPAVKALVACVRESGARAALDVLAERELDESAATGTYQTPAELAALMARLLPPGTARVLDPACGSGTLLAAAACQGATEVYGQDSVPVQALRTAVSLLLDDAAHVTVKAGDSLRADAFPDLTADAVLCNPPFGDRDWGHDELSYDPRWAYGVPPRFESELAWVQHALSHVEPGGYVVMLLPPAPASRTAGRRIRLELVRSGALRAVVALPARAAMPLHIGLQVWVMQRPEPGGPDRGPVLFVDTDGESEGTPRHTGAADARTATVPGRRAPVDWDRLTEQVLTLWASFTHAPSDFTGEPGIARAVPVVDLLDDQVDLTPARLVRATPTNVDPVAYAEHVDEKLTLLASYAAELAAAPAREPWPPAGETARAWRAATVADLDRGGALTLVRAKPLTARESKSGHEQSAAPSDRPVLTAPDISWASPPSGGTEDLVAQPPVTVQEGDVLVRGLASDRAQGVRVRVADAQDAGALLGHLVHLLRPDPARLDPWFLAGFLGAEDNQAAASTGSTLVHVNPGRLRVPLLPLDEQRRYGEAFRRVHALRTAARHTARLAEEAADLLSRGLTGGILAPPPSPAADRIT